MSTLGCKVIFLGNAGVGKSSLLARFIEDTFMERKMPTVGIDFMTAKTKISIDR